MPTFQQLTRMLEEAASERQGREVSFREVLAEEKARRAGLSRSRSLWFGSPNSIWAAEDVFAAVKAGIASPEIIKDMEKQGMGNALANAAVSLGEKYLRTIPGVAEVMGALDIAKDIPIIGGIIESIGGEIVGAIGDIAGGFLGDAVGAITGVVEDIPIVGDVVGVVGDFLGSIF